MKLRARVAFGVCAMAFVTACGRDKWEGYIHQDRTRMDEYDYIGTHPSLTACREMALTVLRFIEAEDLGDYERGKNCRWQMTGDGVIKLCDETGR